MKLFSFFKPQAVETLEWLDPIAQTIVYRYPLQDRPIKMGTLLTVKESQTAVFLSGHKVADVLGPGRYTLKADTLPMLSQMQGWALEASSPFRASLYFVNTRLFTDIPYHASNPIDIEDAEWGRVSIRVIGTYSFKVTDVERFMKSIFDTNQIYDAAYLLGQHRSFLHAGLQTVLAEAGIPIAQLAERKHEASVLTAEHLRTRFSEMGVELSAFAIDEIELPAELASQIEETAASAEEAGTVNNAEEERTEQVLNETCGHLIGIQMKFCPECGASVVLPVRCEGCGYSLQPNMKFCPECGAKSNKD